MQTEASSDAREIQTPAAGEDSIEVEESDVAVEGSSHGKS